MNSIKIHPGYLISVLLFAVICMLIMLDRCGNPRKPDTVTEFYSDTIYLPGDPYPVSQTVKIKEPFYIPVPVPENVDSAKIISDYFSVKFYADTLKNDSSALVAVYDSVYNNEIKSRVFTFQNRRETQVIINNTTVTHNRKESLFKLGIGLNAIYSQKNKSFDAGPGLYLHTRPGFYAGYGYMIGQQGHAVSAGWVVRFRK